MDQLVIKEKKERTRLQLLCNVPKEKIQAMLDMEEEGMIKLSDDTKKLYNKYLKS